MASRISATRSGGEAVASAPTEGSAWLLGDLPPTAPVALDEFCLIMRLDFGEPWPVALSAVREPLREWALLTDTTPCSLSAQGCQGQRNRATSLVCDLAGNERNTSHRGRVQLRGDPAADAKQVASVAGQPVPRAPGGAEPGEKVLAQRRECGHRWSFRRRPGAPPGLRHFRSYAANRPGGGATGPDWRSRTASSASVNRRAPSRLTSRQASGRGATAAHLQPTSTSQPPFHHRQLPRHQQI